MPFDEFPMAKAAIAISGLIIVAGLLYVTGLGPCELTKTDCQGFGPDYSLMRVQDELKKIVQPGYGISTPRIAEMKEGETMSVEDVAETVGIEKHSLRFTCEPKESFCQGPAAPLEVIETPEAGRISANMNAKAYFVACGDASIGKFCIGVGPDAQHARRACTNGCGMG